MIILFLVFLVQFAVACACLAMNVTQQEEIAQKGWLYADDSLKEQTQLYFHCCGFSDTDRILGESSNGTSGGMSHPPCTAVCI